MKIKWLGHAAFAITADNGTKIITDPYTRGGGINYAEINERADIVTNSHNHGDHNNLTAVKGNPQIVKGTAEAKGIKFRAIPAYHDESQGKDRGTNTIFCFELDSVKVCHLGDLGHSLNEKQVKEIGKVDVLLIPAGGFYTFGTSVANQTVEQLQPKVVIPMHFKNEKCAYPIADVEEFLKGKTNVKRLDGSEVEFKASNLPARTTIMVLKPAL